MRPLSSFELISRFWWMRLKNLANTQNRHQGLQILVFGFFSILVLYFIGYGSHRLLLKLDSLNGESDYATIMATASSMARVGDLLKERLLAMVLLAIFFLVFVSSVLNSLSHLFLSQDSDLLLATPTNPKALFDARCFEAITSSTWMSFLFFLPVLAAYAHNYDTSPIQLFPFMLCLAPYLLIPSLAGVSFSLALALWFPVQKSKKIFNFLAVFFLTLLIVLIRMLQPEKLFAMQSFEELGEFVRGLNLPLHDSLPPAWLSQIGIHLLMHQAEDAIEPATWLFLSAILVLALVRKFGHFAFLPGLHKSREMSAPSIVQESTLARALNLRWLPQGFRPIFYKDALLFARNPEIWSQVFLILAMVGLYMYNLWLLKLDQIGYYSLELSRLIAVLNTAFVSFITTSVAMRFLFPAISLEGPAFWLLRTAPIQLTRLLRYKFLFYLPYILLMSWFMTLIANWILKVGPLYYAITLINITILGIVNSLLAITMGAIFPNFKAENVNRIFMSYGGTFYMISALAFLVLFLGSQVYPGMIYYRLKMGTLSAIETRQMLGMGASLSVGLLSLVAFTVLPWHWARQRLMLEEESFL